MSRDMRDRKPLLREGLSWFLGLVVAVGVDGVLGDDHEDVGSAGEDDDRGALVGSSDAEVSEFAGVADADFPAGVDGVVADAPVLVAVDVVGFGFGECGVCLGRCAPSQCAVGAVGVVDVLEPGELAVQLLSP